MVGLQCALRIEQGAFSFVQVFAREPAPFMTRARLFLILTLFFTTAACQPLTRLPEPVKVGLLLPLEGERRELSYSLLPAYFSATAENVQGRPIEWVILDTHGDPATAAQRARELVIDPAVLYVLGPLLADEAEAVALVVAEAGVAWTALVPRERTGVWMRDWEAECWANAQHESSTTGNRAPCHRVALPEDTSDFEDAVGGEAAPLSWLVWDATSFLMGQLRRAPALERMTVEQASEPYSFPPLEPYNN